MPGAGELDRRIAIERLTETGRDPFNEPIVEWVTLVSTAAKRADASTGEKFAAGQVGATLMAHFTVRSSPTTRTITATDRLIHEGEVWNIMPPKETKDGRRRYLEITATRDADA